MPMTLSSRSLAVAAVSCLATTLSGCAHTAGQAPQVMRNVTLRESIAPRATDTVVFRRTITRAGRDTSGGTRTVVTHRRQAEGGAPLLEVEQRFPAGGGEIVDTAIADARTLRAISHASYQPTRTMRFEFDGSTARGIVTTRPSDTEPSPVRSTVRQEVGGPVFDSNVIDLVVARLPLREGFQASVPFFIYEQGGRVEMPVRVTSRTTDTFGALGARAVWVVSVGVPGAPATVWVDAQAAEVLRVRYDIAARNMSMTDERITPLPRTT
jgi:hypothetical protein